jgi:colanic acid/amylovoran biosynthesis glycosyltransferase
LKKSTKILVTATTFPRSLWDTSPRFVYDLCATLAKLGKFQPIVLVPHSEGSKTYELFDGIHVYRYRYFLEKLEIISGNGIVSKIKNKKILSLIVPFLIFFQFIYTIRLIRQHEIKIILSNWIVPQALISILVKPFFPELRLVTISHGGDAAILNKNTALKFLARFILKRVHAVIAVSSFIQMKLNDTGFNEKEIHVIPMGVNLDSFRAKSNQIPQKKERDLVFVGRLEKKKGLSYLIDAVKILEEKHSLYVKISIIGDGSQKTLLQNRVRELGIETQVIFLGALTHEEIIPHLTMSRIFVAPSINLSDDVEGMPTVIMEALSVGLPVITTDAGGIKDVICHGQNGIIVRQKSADDLSDAIKVLLQNTEYQNLLKINALKTVKKYSYDNIARQYEKLILKVMNE